MYNLLQLENNILKQRLVSPHVHRNHQGICTHADSDLENLSKIICGDAKNTQAHFDSKVLKKSYNLQFLKIHHHHSVLQSIGLEIFSIKFLTCEPNTFPSLSYLIHHMLYHFLKIYFVSVSVHAHV